MPTNYKDYPKYWKWISMEIRKAAGDKCELCFAPNGEFIIRNKPDEGSYPWRIAGPDDGEEGQGLKITKIVLTVHHIDANKNNNTQLNLISLCQKCHLRLDLERHLKNRKKRQFHDSVGGSVPFL